MVIYDRVGVANRLRNRRKELGMTAEGLAKHIGKAGPYYRDIECGRCGMSIETLIKLSTFLGLSIDYIIYGSETGENGQELSPSCQASYLFGICDEQTRNNALVLLKTFLGLSQN